MDDKTTAQLKEEVDQLLTQVEQDKNAFWENVKQEMGGDVDIAQVKDISYLLEENLRPMLADLNLSDTEYAFLQTAILGQIEEEINYMFEDLLPTEVWDKLEVLLTSGALEPQEVLPILAMAYEAIMGKSIMYFAKGVMQDVVAKTKKFYEENRAYGDKFEQLSPEQRKRFEDLVDQDKFEEAKKVLEEVI